MTVKQTIEEQVLRTFRLRDGKIERLCGHMWQDTSWYKCQDSFNIGEQSITRAALVEILNNYTAVKEEVEVFSIAQQARLQKAVDSNRIERAIVRKEVRKLNESNALFDKLIGMISARPSQVIPREVANTSGGTLVIQLSDLHLGTTIALPNNIVNTKVLSKRLYKYIEAAIQFGLKAGVNRCIFALTGDLVTSNRRPGEVATLEYNRAHAVLNAFELISGAINLVSSYIPVTNVVSVCANESRIDLFLELNHKCLYENFDWIVDRMLNAHYNGAIKFSDFINPVERLVSIDGVNLLLTHGLVKPKDSADKQVAYYKTKYPDMHYMICGHIHSEYVALGFSRSSGLPGANDYSTFSLGIPTSCPGQTFHLVQDGRVFSFPIDLTEVGENSFQFTQPPTSEAIAVVRETL